MVENLFIIFPPGAGGNHFANLISLSDRFNRDVDVSQYNKQSAAAHFSPVVNLRIDSIRLNLTQLKNRNNVLCGHIGEYLWLKTAGLADEFPNKKFLVVELPRNNELATKRLHKTFIEYQNIYFYEEQRTLYSVSVLSIMFEEDDWFVFPSDNLFVESSESICSFIKDELCTDVSTDKLDDLHTKWFNNITKTLDQETNI